MTDKMNLNSTKEEWFNWVPNGDGGEEWRKEFRMRWDTGKQGGGGDSSSARTTQTAQIVDKKIKTER